MPPLSEHQSTTSTKLLLLGDSGSGKSGALASLAHAGFNLRILDFDNGLDALRSYLTDPKSPYDKSSLARVHYRTLTEPMKNIGGKLMASRATAWQACSTMLTKWAEGETDLGSVESWGPQDILVIDSLTMLSQAALNFHLSLQGALTKTRTQNEHRRDIWGAQDLVEHLLMLLYDTSIKCNVIVTSHITYVAEGAGAEADAMSSLPKVGYPSSIGQALSPKIPRYFNSCLHIKTIGSGPSARHKIFTSSQGIVATKSSAPLAVAPSYDIGFGLAEYFTAVRGKSAA